MDKRIQILIDAADCWIRESSKWADLAQKEKDAARQACYSKATEYELKAQDAIAAADSLQAQLDYLRWFSANVDLGPLNEDTRDMMNVQYESETGNKAPGEEDDVR